MTIDGLRQATWAIGPIATPSLTWGARRGGREHKCGTCGIKLLTGEEAGFCCGPGGSRFSAIPPLPPLPPEYAPLLSDPRVSSLSRRLNVVFSFASLETTARFGDSDMPGFFAIGGRVYHRVRPTHKDSAVHWLLYDGFERNKPPHERWANTLPSAWIDAMRAALQAHNPFVQHLRILSELDPTDCPEAELHILDSGASEIAAIMCYENTSQSQIKPRTIVISRSSSDIRSQTTQIPITSRLWEPLAYPLFFPDGTLGWGIAGDVDDITAEGIRSRDSEPETSQIWFYRGRLLREPRFAIFGRLTNEYVVDMFSRNLEARLKYIRDNQRRIQQEDAELMGTETVNDSENIYLPASFLGSNRWASEQIADSLAIAAMYGPPTFFITITCNSQWPEIQSQLLPGQDYTDNPVVVCRVFRRKLMLLEKALRSMFPNAGGLLYIIHCVEFQKRGLPHAHILVKYASDCTDPSDIDSVISAEMPSDAADAQLVLKFMTHHHPPPNKPASKYCQRELDNGERHCRFNYPQPIVETTYSDHAGRVHYRRRTEHDAWIVPYNIELLRKFQCHLNVEAANSSHLFQYIFKYIHKGVVQRSSSVNIVAYANLYLKVLTVQSSAYLPLTTTRNLSTRSRNIGTLAICLRARLLGGSSDSTSPERTPVSHRSLFTFLNVRTTTASIQGAVMTPLRRSLSLSATSVDLLAHSPCRTTQSARSPASLMQNTSLSSGWRSTTLRRLLTLVIFLNRMSAMASFPCTLSAAVKLTDMPRASNPPDHQRVNAFTCALSCNTTLSHHLQTLCPQMASNICLTRIRRMHSASLQMITRPSTLFWKRSLHFVRHASSVYSSSISSSTTVYQLHALLGRPIQPLSLKTSSSRTMPLMNLASRQLFKSLHTFSRNTVSPSLTTAFRSLSCTLQRFNTNWNAGPLNATSFVIVLMLLSLS